MDKKPIKFEYSAGGVVVKKEDGKILILVTKHSKIGHWSFPKGWIDKGEKAEQTALREVKEEGGVEAKILKKVGNIKYFFVDEGVRVLKTVTYFLMEYVSGSEKDHDWEVSEAEWVEKERILERLSYKADKEIFGKAFELI